MEFGVVGINYKKAQLDIRDKTSFTDGMKEDFFHKAASVGVEQVMILSTCNRSEVYYFYEQEEQQAQIQKAYEEMFSDISLKNYLIMLSGKEAMAYLFRIAAGMESLVLGEDQILGQVKEALECSVTMGHSGKEMNKAVRDAVTCAKKIQTKLKISEKPLSVSYIGIQRLNESCEITGKKILVIGSGKTAALALKYIFEYQTSSVTACSRNYAHAKALREEFPEIQIISYEERYEAMKECDIVISATSSPHLVVRRDCFTPVRPLCFLDLAAPRDIDMAFAEDALVDLINLDELQKIVKENEKERKNLVKEGGRLVEEELQETMNWFLSSRMDATIESLQQRCNTIVEDSYGYLNRKMELSQREQKLLKKVLNASLQRLLREPIQELKHLDTKDEQEEFKKLVEQLFQI
ncbi:MAG: glutamyl-tRNA reductase [Lachnospiraceae bacterium]|nr:glutamyl-tRNA reductase [Lachnospiraceae bacterium]